MCAWSLRKFFVVLMVFFSSFFLNAGERVERSIARERETFASRVRQAQAASVSRVRRPASAAGVRERPIPRGHVPEAAEIRVAEPEAHDDIPPFVRPALPCLPLMERGIEAQRIEAARRAAGNGERTTGSDTNHSGSSPYLHRSNGTNSVSTNGGSSSSLPSWIADSARSEEFSQRLGGRQSSHQEPEDMSINQHEERGSAQGLPPAYAFSEAEREAALRNTSEDRLPHYESLLPLQPRVAVMQELEPPTYRGVIQDSAAARLLQAAVQGDVKNVAIFLGQIRPEDVFTIKDAEGRTVLHAAVFAQQRIVVERLLSFIRRQHMDMAQILLLQDNAGRTVLHLAAINDNTEMAALLCLTFGEEAALSRIVNARDRDGRTALHLASIEKNEEMIGYLVREEANKSLRDRFGKTAFSYASARLGLRRTQELFRDL